MFIFIHPVRYLACFAEHYTLHASSFGHYTLNGRIEVGTLRGRGEGIANTKKRKEKRRKEKKRKEKKKKKAAILNAATTTRGCQDSGHLVQDEWEEKRNG
ncbi:hypothetical protein BO83DRAFT_201111 [Aspergillus eucalypticola CBS 122712]|uniref:Uncharacterized protein n=1 Tax=Aspergillus eucalypticola (strain CBS 122712 / IBT 29274) TaxID=1448314 RepID=A0A317W297_ASPEC|nr:uncharacterized protein BO83DRAFT_201111 [Aspergillus eucalypticola CBS 122712]PWY80009.1 hypothetical protein BO83DRAFT_201111 [Aspergillus eucalypticola CBS 122712]